MFVGRVYLNNKTHASGYLFFVAHASWTNHIHVQSILLQRERYACVAIGTLDYLGILNRLSFQTLEKTIFIGQTCEDHFA